MSFDVYAKTEDIIDNNKESDNSKLIFSGIEHNHSENPTKLQIIMCNRCTMDKADASIKQKLLDIQEQPQVVMKNIVTGIDEKYEVERIIISRGLFDDAIGTEITWKPI